MSQFIKRYLAEKISLQKMAGSLGRLSSVLAKSTIQLNPHQIKAVQFAFSSPLRRGAILADEVGLGKTIEAGILISQLWAENKKRILIITPASLRKQWQDELSTHFGLDSEIYDSQSFKQKVSAGEKVPLTHEGIFIVSYHFAYANAGLIEKQLWDVVIIDEAHRMRRVYRGRDASKMAYTIREIIRDKPKALLTATPLQNNLMELYGLVSFIDDKLLGTDYSFKTRYVDPLSEISDANKPLLTELRGLLLGEEDDGPSAIAGVLIRTLRRHVLEYIRFTRRHSMTFDFTPTDEEVELYEKVSAYLARPAVAAIQATQRNLMILVYRKLLASSSYAISGTLEKLINFLKVELELRIAERENKPKLSEAPLFENHEIEDEGVEDEAEEPELEGAEEARPVKPRISESLYSDEAIANEIKELKSYYDLAISIKVNSKGEALIRALKSLFEKANKQKWPQKAVVFTESRRTQEYLIDLFKQNGISYTQFNGSNNSSEAREIFKRWSKEYPEAAATGSVSANMRQALISDFKKNKQILLTTEAGAEGLNLQFCNIIVNYDLPWNPQRVEQRIGRCHRYGQEYDVIVANFLNTRNRADRRVLELLQTKLNLFDGLFGSSDEILGALESGIDFEKRILEIYQSCRLPEEIDQAFDELQATLGERISDSMVKLRSKLLDFDDSVKGLFKKTKQETEMVLSAFDKTLLRLCKICLGPKLKEVGSGIYSISLNGQDKIIAFRELKAEEVGKILRAHKESPIITDLIAESLSGRPESLPSLAFNYSKSGKKITPLNKYIGRDGFVFLYKLKIKGIEEEDVLAPLTFVKHNGQYSSLDLPTAEQLLELEYDESSKVMASVPFSQEEVEKEWHKWKTQALSTYQKKNEKLYDREIDRINRYYKDYALRQENRLAKLDEEEKELERRKTSESDFEKRREINKRLQDINVQKGRAVHGRNKLEEEALLKKEQEFKELESKFELNTEETLIAIAHFELI